MRHLALTPCETRRRRVGKAYLAEVRLRRIVSRDGIPSVAARSPRVAIVQGTMLYASELTRMAGKEWTGIARRLSTE